MEFSLILCLLLVFSVISKKVDETSLNKDWSYCFEFTWFGPQYDNFTRINKTCHDYYDDKKINNIPCSPPIVITYDGSPPDLNYLWKSYRNSVLCRKSKNEVCARYTYKYNGVVNNVTYMCTKVQAMGENAITRGCFKQNYQGYEVELCVCESNPGLSHKPCNSARSIQGLYIMFLLIIFMNKF